MKHLGNLYTYPLMLLELYVCIGIYTVYRVIDIIYKICFKYNPTNGNESLVFSTSPNFQTSLKVSFVLSNDIQCLYRRRVSIYIRDII